MSEKTILEVRGLTTEFRTATENVLAVDGLDFTLRESETLAIVGESGCGKSATSLSILRLIPNPPGKITSGEILYKGQDLLQLSPKAMRKIRGSDISMVFQEPMTSLNPVFTVGRQIMESLQIHQGMNKAQAREKALEMLELVGLPNPAKRLRNYPHQLSGGMRQRVMIAMALACNPNILIADEPTTALDVTIQAQILRLMMDLKTKLGTAIIFITHDLGVVAQFAQNVMVMYAGEAVEYADVRKLFKQPLHPYTLGLLKSIPDPVNSVEMLYTIPGTVPQSLRMQGCKFESRCAYATQQCRQEHPVLLEVQPGHQVRCWNYKEVLAGER
ncbi:MAG: ABC transporter ATP-binding protein [Clostridiales bacterium]|nr:ABC transporter ATP-binding protein [Clostridiales bacterium]